MVDFKRLRANRELPPSHDPIEIFRRLPKSSGINDLYDSQGEVLREWYKKREQQDIVIKLHTGGGKTLVGLLIAQSMLIEYQEPVAYLCPTRQLVEQSVSKASEYNISVVKYLGGDRFLPDEFKISQKILITTYDALFNGRSKFGISGSGSIISLGGIIFDDAHVAFSNIRDVFTLKVDRDKNPDEYFYITSLFRDTFKDKRGTFDDILERADYSILEVPYWVWEVQWQSIHRYILEHIAQESFAWSLIKNDFKLCHCLISSDAIAITPILPLINRFPSFQQCHHRVYMSATIGDDSAIIQTFDASSDAVKKPISSLSLAGVSERMILQPEIILPDDSFPLFQYIIEYMINNYKKDGVVILAPSLKDGQLWQPLSKLAENSSQVEDFVQLLQSGESFGPYTFANRYDGIDLPQDSCRLLILSGLPKGMSEYERYQNQVFEGGSLWDITLAQKIEQGIGRGARGAGDYCVVLLYSRDLVSWSAKIQNQKFLTKSTQAQLAMGLEITKEVQNKEQLIEVIEQCLDRNKDWIEYHANRLASSEAHEIPKDDSIDYAAIQRRAYRLVIMGDYLEATGELEEFIQKHPTLDTQKRGWLLQLAARFAYSGGDENKSRELQKRAFGSNNNLLRHDALTYLSLPTPSKQSFAIAQKLSEYNPHRGILKDFDEKMNFLVASAPANQFEKAVEDLGKFLGFSAHRPDNLYRVGPDILWLMEDQKAFIMEAKSRKSSDKPLTKGESGQLHNAMAWFKQQYPHYESFLVSIHPCDKAEREVIISQLYLLNLDYLDQQKIATKSLYEEMKDWTGSESELASRIELLLLRYNLTPKNIMENYLKKFKHT